MVTNPRPGISTTLPWSDEPRRPARHGGADIDGPHPTRERASRWSLAGWTLLLFLVWSNSFIAIGYLLGSEEVPARFDWLGLTIARFLPVGAVALLLVLVLWREEARRVVRRRWRRLFLCGLFAVPGYNFALYYGQQHGIAPPVASLLTALAPLFLMLLGAAFLGEGLSGRKVAGFAIALGGLVVMSRAKAGTGGASYPLLIATTALAPLSWSFYSALSKPVSRECSPVLWAYLTLVFGTVPLLALAPMRGGMALYRLDAPGWAALLYLAVLCTVFGNAAWTWLVKHLPASSVGFTIFLNPPLTTLSKAVLAAALPALFAFRIVPAEWIGGAVVLLGMAVALSRSAGGAKNAPEGRATNGPDRPRLAADADAPR